MGKNLQSFFFSSRSSFKQGAENGAESVYNVGIWALYRGNFCVIYEIVELLSSSVYRRKCYAEIIEQSKRHYIVAKLKMIKYRFTQYAYRGRKWHSVRVACLYI